ncbi:hypothetical protein AKJ49_01000, partial [candidate division MSBL1 archaeon SCGC-AAA382A03]
IMKERKMKIKQIAHQIDYQLALREKFDFLPNFYGTLITQKDTKDIIVNFYEYIPPLNLPDITISDFKKILKIIEKLYKQNYYGIDLKLSNFGKKDNKIYYLDERGIGEYLPPDWTKLLNTKIGKKLTPN